MNHPYGLQPYQVSSSPAGQGSSVREFEEFANLVNENLNLKLRLYINEESIPGYKQTNSSSEATQKQKYDKIIKQQETTIKILKAELKKKTADLQKLVHKELWEKIREIERLNKTCASPNSPSQSEVTGELQQSFSDVEYNKALQRNKLLQRKVDVLIQRLGSERQNDALIAQLKTELNQARLDADTADKRRRQCADLCATLSTRLKELAGFLNSLLRHKDVLGVLAVDKRKAMRRAVDRSLDLSKSLNMTLSVSGISMIDQSLAELHNLSDILGEVAVQNKNETDSNYSESNSRSFKARTQERISQLEQQIQQRDNRIIEIQSQLLDADNRLKKEKLKLLEVNRELNQVKQRNEELHNDLIAIGSQEPSNIHNESILLQQIDEKSRSLEKLQEERVRLLVESELAEMIINFMKADMEIFKQTYKEILQQAAEKEKQELSSLKQELDSKFQELDSKLQQALLDQKKKHQEFLQRDYIAKPLYEECCQQLTELEKQYIEAQRSIDRLQENELELKQTLVETELTSRNLQKQIDESTLRASKADMERVKAIIDALQLEKRVEELSLELNKYEEERLNMQHQIKHLEQKHQALLGHITVLQSKQKSPAKNDDNQSGYTSEEVPICNASGTQANQSFVAQQRLGEQRIQNSSPDLGIESDAGRVSSVDLNNIQRPLLKTVEMSPKTKHSGNESDDKEGFNDSSTENIKPTNVPEANSPSQQLLSKKHDCLKVEQENAELRRKLLRTKRAFEDTYEKLRNAFSINNF